ncbi:hypothetical protein [Streptomyces bobili]|uniref:hypothetical protein n=1 Tax=Streptomyces bobili TaxID=67280 RepID=UPI0037210D8A
MTTTIAAGLDTADLEQTVALIACGTRPGKTQACDRHRHKAQGLLEIASWGAIDALAAAICDSTQLRACAPCVEKAVDIIHVVNGDAE